MTGVQALILSSLLGTALVVYGLRVRAAPFSVDIIEQCVVHGKGAYVDRYGYALGLGRFVDGQVCLLLTFFNDICRTLAGKALGTVFASIMFPVTAIAFLLAANQGGVRAVTYILLTVVLGQLITIGIALNLLWLPYFWNVLQNKEAERTLLRPSSPSTLVTLTSSLLAALSAALPTFVITASHPFWPYANFLFQMFPLAFIPLLFQTKAGKKPRPENATSYAVFLKALGIAAAVVWLLGLVQSLLDFDLPAIEETESMAKNLVSPLFLKTLSGPRFPLRLRSTLGAEFNEGAQFLLFDLLSVTSAMAAAIHFHARATTQRSPFAAKDWQKLLIGGPGMLFTSYWSRQFAQQSEKAQRWQS